ncbi:YjcZ family sporulation protein [Cytobacillus gottheilii]|uniref:YjcZ family sporulation protein n=1 Tax=Cytobacillus gottheilii TaxID=859144 RepID=UPI0009BA0151|nr:YjcZ family sporulation protein [Cytobacillus gottheilii]
MNYGYNYGCGDPCYTPSYSYPVAGAYSYPATGGFQGFALIVVLFILLIIIGASCYGK